MRTIGTFIALTLAPTSIVYPSSSFAQEAVTGPFYSFSVPLADIGVGTGPAGEEGGVLTFFANENGDILAPSVTEPSTGTTGVESAMAFQSSRSLSGCVWQVVNGRWRVRCDDRPRGMVIALQSVEGANGLDFEIQSWVPFEAVSPSVMVEGFNIAPEGLATPRALEEK